MRQFLINTLLSLASIGLVLSSSLQANDKPIQNLIPASLISLGKGPFYSNHVFVVDKSKRTLVVWKQTDKGYFKMKEIHADFGGTAGDKTVVGDHKTPEGIYFFPSYLEKAKLDFREYGWHDVKAFTMDYPNLFDRRDGKTGSGIWLHTLPDNTPLTRGSRGCVVIRNNDFEEAKSLIKLMNTPIIVQDKVKYISPKELEAQRELMVTWLKKWLNAWESKKLQDYMSFYDKTFRSKRMNFDQWKEYKSGLATEYGKINISISEPRIVHFRDEWIVQFIQKYKSDKYQDFGHKTLYIKGSTIENLKIIAEDFDVTTSNIAIAQYDASNFNCCATSDLTSNSNGNRNVTTTKN